MLRACRLKTKHTVGEILVCLSFLVSIFWDRPGCHVHMQPKVCGGRCDIIYGRAITQTHQRKLLYSKKAGDDEASDGDGEAGDTITHTTTHADTITHTTTRVVCVCDCITVCRPIGDWGSIRGVLFHFILLLNGTW